MAERLGHPSDAGAVGRVTWAASHLVFAVLGPVVLLALAQEAARQAGELLLAGREGAVSTLASHTWSSSSVLLTTRWGLRRKYSSTVYSRGVSATGASASRTSC